MSLQAPALDPADLEPQSHSGYPEPYRSRVLPREVRRLGEALGLQHLGINLVRILPGKQSSMRHWHTREDEFVYLIEGELVLRTDAGEQLLRAGCCAGFAAGSEDGHHFINRSAQPALFLVVSNRDPEDTGFYSDPDVDLGPVRKVGGMSHRDGTPY